MKFQGSSPRNLDYMARIVSMHLGLYVKKLVLPGEYFAEDNEDLENYDMPLIMNNLPLDETEQVFESNIVSEAEKEINGNDGTRQAFWSDVPRLWYDTCSG